MIRYAAVTLNLPGYLSCPKRNPTVLPNFLGDHLLLLFLTLVTLATLGGGLGLLAADTARAAATEGRSQSEVDVLLGVEADHVGGHVDDLLADTVRVVSIWLSGESGGVTYRM